MLEEENKNEESKEDATEDLSLFYPVTKSIVQKQSQRSYFDDLLRNQRAEAPSFREQLLQQILFLSLTEQEQTIAKYLIESLTDHGYLIRSLEIILAEIELIHGTRITKKEAESVLKKIQETGPPGIGARNLQESLILQLHAQKPNPNRKNALEILIHHFDIFQKKHYNKLIKKLHISPHELQQSLEIITKLRPYPILPTFTEAKNSILEPDFLVYIYEGKIKASLVDNKLPTLKINQYYQQLLQKQKSKKQRTK